MLNAYQNVSKQVTPDPQVFHIVIPLVKAERNRYQVAADKYKD